MGDLLSSLGFEQSLALAVFLAALALFLLTHRQVRLGRRPLTRPLIAFQRLNDYASQAAEAGRAMHVSLGTAGIGGAAVADALAGLWVLERLAEQAAATGQRLIVTLADSTLLPLAQDILRRAYERVGLGSEYDPLQVRLLAPNPIAYAAGAMGLLSREPVSVNVMLGSFGDEFLLISENGVRRGLPQLGGASSPAVLPFVQLSMDHPLWGEEIYAGGAYLSAVPSHLASLFVEDWLRTGIIFALFLGSLMLTFA